MSPQNSQLVTQTQPVKYVPDHPLSSLTASEIKTAARLVKALFPGRTDWQFKAITLEEPPKAALIPFLEAEHGAKPLPTIEREAFVAYYLRTTVIYPLSMSCRSRLTGHYRVAFTRPS